MQNDKEYKSQLHIDHRDNVPDARDDPSLDNDTVADNRAPLGRRASTGVNVIQNPLKVRGLLELRMRRTSAD